MDHHTLLVFVCFVEKGFDHVAQAALLILIEAKMSTLWSVRILLGSSSSEASQSAVIIDMSHHAWQTETVILKKIESQGKGLGRLNKQKVYFGFEGKHF